MANTRASIREIRKSKTRAVQNRTVLTRIKSIQKKSLASAEGKTASDQAPQIAAEFMSTVDKAAKRGIIHQSKASRLKSVAVRHLKAATSK